MTQQKMETAISQIRGNRKVTSDAAENTYEALLKYSTDLVALAEQGKLDPGILCNVFCFANEAKHRNFLFFFQLLAEMRKSEE